jgi:NAD(P)-dependent dehydrogenase (short-subunit alcohol dehydrogenase family)
MDLNKKTVLILGGAGLVGIAVARRILEASPARLVLASLRREEAEEAVADLKAAGFPHAEIDPYWGDLLVPEVFRERAREEVLADPESRRQLIDDLYGDLTLEVFRRSALGKLLLDVRPEVIVDCINTAGAFAYQNAFASAAELRARAHTGKADVEAVERHLATMYLPLLIRHVQIALAGMRRAGTSMYVKVGTSGTGGMGLNIPFTHSEERPSRQLLAKSAMAGAHTLLLYLMARTPGAPALKEVKPTAAICWKSIGYGPVKRGGTPIMRVDATEAVPLDRAFGAEAGNTYRQTDRPLDGVYLDAGENGLFSIGEFETLTALGLMEFLTPEEIADSVIQEIDGQSTGFDVVASLDAVSMGPTYRAGALRSIALRRMEQLEEEHDVRSVAYEMLGPPRLSKLLFEGSLLERLYDTLDAACELDPEETATQAQALVEADDDLRQRMLTAGLPILLPDGQSVLRGPQVNVPPIPNLSPFESGIVKSGWVDLRSENWEWWRECISTLRTEIDRRPSVDSGSLGDHEYGDETGRLRPGRVAAWIFRYIDHGERVKR